MLPKSFYSIPVKIQDSPSYGRLPKPLRSLVVRAENWAIPRRLYFRAAEGANPYGSNEYELPDGESVTCYGVWAVELFPPSMSERFIRAMERNAWDRLDVKYGNWKGNAHMFQDIRGRAGSGAWWRLGEVVDEGSNALVGLRGVRGRLPEPFSRVSLSAHQIGAGTTAIVAFFELKEDAKGSITRELSSSHEPGLRHVRGRRARFVSREASCREAVQGLRSRMHDSARLWLAVSCPGFFAGAGNAHPVADFILFGKADPMVPGRRDDEDLYGVLGLHSLFWVRWFPKSFDSLALAEKGDVFDGQIDNCLSIVGNDARAVEAMKEETKYHGSSDGGAIAMVLDEWMAKLLAMRGMLGFFEVEYGRYGKKRDGAVATRGRSLRKDLRDLKRSLLSDGIDIPELVRDSGSSWLERCRNDLGDVPGSFCGKDEFEYRGRHDYVDELCHMTQSSMELLINVRKTYVSVSTAVADLDSAMSSRRWAVAAVVISVVSLLVAVLTLAFSGDDSALETFFALLCP